MLQLYAHMLEPKYAQVAYNRVYRYILIRGSLSLSIANGVVDDDLKYYSLYRLPRCV